MSETAEPGPLGHQPSLYDHALRLHHLDPDVALARDGEPFPMRHPTGAGYAAIR